MIADDLVIESEIPGKKLTSHGCLKAQTPITENVRFYVSFTTCNDDNMRVTHSREMLEVHLHPRSLFPQLVYHSMLAFSYLPNNLQFLAISVFMVQKKDKHKCMAIGNKLECLQHKKQYMKTIAVILALPLIHHRLLWQQKQILQLKGLMDVEKFSGLSSCSTCFCTTAQSRERLHNQYMDAVQLIL